MKSLHLALVPLATLAAVSAPEAAAQAESYPERSIRLIAPYPPGGGVDIASRAVAQKLTEIWKQQVLVDNRGGAGGNIGVDIAAKSAPDGYTWVMGAAGPIAINVTLYRKMPYDPVRDLAPIVLVAPTFYALVVHPSVPAKSVKDLVGLAKAQPGKVTFGSSGVGGPPHLAGELLKVLSGTEMVHVPYKGTGPAVAALLGGEITFMLADALAALPQAKAGKLRALAISSAKRVPFAPDLPTVAESGAPGYEAIGWSGLLAPAGTPRPIIDKINAEVRRILRMPDIQARLSSDGSLFGDNTPDAFGAFIKAEIAKWGKVVKASGATAD